MDDASSASDITGQTVGQYRLVRKLGEGGMAAVFLAQGPDGREVALKLPFAVPSELETTVKRLQREAQAGASIEHPNVCAVYEVGDHAGRLFLAMQYIAGMSLADWLQQAPQLTADDAAAIVAKAARGIEAAHQAGVLHRDLKTANIMMTDAGEPIVTDFGMARWTEAQHTVLTPSGAMVGTPGYMAPEQIMGDNDRVGPATDVYALGVILYELLTGWMPFSGNLATMLGSIISEPPPALSTHVPDIDRRLEAVCLRALAKEPERRYASAGAFAQALESYRSAPAVQEAADRPGEAGPPASGGGVGAFFRRLVGRRQ